MKNITTIETNCKCENCDKKGFIVYTPDGADFHTCPVCGHYDYMNDNYNSQEYNEIFQNLEEDNIYDKYDYCENCNIVFVLGCDHSVQGCTDTVYNGHFIGKWKYKNNEYIGMPQFENVKEWHDEFPNIEIIEFICIHNGLRCSNRDKKYSESFYGCCLTK